MAEASHSGLVPGSSRPPARAGLKEIWHHIRSGAEGDYTTVVVPTLTFDREELAKILGVQFYEERLLVCLLTLRDPRARVVFVTSQPVPPPVVSYYLSLLPDGVRHSAGERLAMLSAHDTTPRPLTEKILERPRLIDRIRAQLGSAERAYMTSFNVTLLEERLALELGIPHDGVDAGLSWMGTKSGSRKIFSEAGVQVAAGSGGVRTRADLVEGLAAIATRQPTSRAAVVKLDDSFAGAGNAFYTFPTTIPTDPVDRMLSIDRALNGLVPASGEPPHSFLQKLERMGGVVEAFVEGGDGMPSDSPSAQLLVDPDGTLRLLSTHDQVLGGPIGQTYVGCRFPASDAYRSAIQERGLAVGRAMSSYGATGRFGIDFLVPRLDGDPGVPHAIEINLRMGGTTFPFMVLELLVEGAFDPATGRYVADSGGERCYFATDNLRSPAYAGITPEDFIDIVRRYDLRFDRELGIGPVFHMIGALSQFGRVGVTCIGRDPDEADTVYRRVVAALDSDARVDRPRWAPATHPMGIPIGDEE